MKKVENYILNCQSNPRIILQIGFIPLKLFPNKKKGYTSRKNLHDRRLFSSISEVHIIKLH